MAGNQFKIRVGTEFDAAGLEAQIKKHLKDHKITISFDADTSSVTKASKKMQENARDVKEQFKEAYSLQRQITSIQRQLSSGNLSKSTADNLRKTVTTLRTELNKLYNDYGKKFSDSQRLALEKARGGTPSKQIGNTKDSYREMLQLIQQIEKESKNMLSNNIDTRQFELAESRVKALRAEYDAFRNSVNGQLNLSQLNKLDSAIQRAENNIESMRTRLADSLTKQISSGSFTRSFREAEAQVGGFKRPDMLASTFGRLREAYQSIQNLGPIVDVDSFNKAKTAVDRYNNALDEYRNRYKILKNEQDKILNGKLFEQNKENFGLQIDYWLKNNSAAVTQFGHRLEELKTKAKNAFDPKELQLYQGEFRKIQLEAKNAGVAMMTFGDRLKAQAREYISYIGVATVAMAGLQVFRDMARNVLEVDTAMTGLYRVTDLTSQQYDQLYSNMTDSAREYGATLTDIINATADWTRAGFDANTANQLAEITTMYQHIADLDYATASENLLTAYNGFKNEFTNDLGWDAVQSVGYITDVLNELDNKYSVTAAGIGDALQRNASAMDLAGNTFQETAAMITGMTEVIQDPEKSGQALKILSLRLRGMKGELQALGEEVDSDVDNISKMQGQILNLTHGKVNIFDDQGEFKSTYEIMNDIAAVWKDMNSIEQADLLETIAGKNRANEIAALISNWGNVRTAVVDATNAEGSAARENEKYMQHLQSALDRFQSAWQELSVTTLKSDFLTNLVDAGTNAIDVINGLVESFGALKPLIVGIFGGASLLGKGAFKSSKDGIGLMGTQLTDLLDAFKTGSGRGDNPISSFLFGLDEGFAKFNRSMSKFDRDTLTKYKDALGRNASGRELTEIFDGASESVQDLITSADGGADALANIGNSAGKSRVAMLGMKAATLALNVGLGLLVSVAISAAIKAFDNLVHAEENASKAADDAFTDASASAAQTAEDYRSLNDLISQYNELSSQDTSDPTVRLQIADVQNQINDLVGDEAAGLDLVNGSLNEQLNLLNQIRESQAQKSADASRAAYYAAKDAEEAAYGQDEFLFGNYDSMSWDGLINGRGFSLINAFSEAGYGDFYGATLFNSYVDLDSIDSAQEKLEVIQGMLKTLESNYDDFASMEIYKDLQKAYEYYSQYADQTSAAARDALEQQTQALALESDFSSILDANAEQFASARESLVNSLMSNGDISAMINAGDLSTDDVVAYVNTYLGSLENFSVGYAEWADNITSLRDMMSVNGLYDLEGTGIDTGEMNKIDSYINQISRLQDAYSDFRAGELDTEEIDKLMEDFPELEQIIQDAGIGTDNLDIAIMSLLDSLNSDMVDNFNSSIGDISTMSEDAQQKVTILGNAIKNFGVLGDAMSFSIDIAGETDVLSNLNAAVAASKTATGLTSEQIENVNKAFSSLEGYDSTKMFEETANGIRLNTQEYNRFSQALTDGKLQEANANLETLQDSLSITEEKLKKARQAGDTDLIADLTSQRDDIREQIALIGQQAAMYEGLTSSYKEWQDAQSAGNDRDLYESVGSGFEEMQDEINRGWWDDSTREYLELLTGRDLSTANIDDMRDAYAQLDQTIGDTGYTIKSFFTQTEDGKFDTNGIYNFLEAAESFESALGYDFVKRNEEGNIIGFDISVDGRKALAEAMGISEELVDIIIRASEDAGFVVNMDGTYTQLADMKKAAEQAAVELKNTFGKTQMDFTFDTSDMTTFNAELEEAHRIWEQYRNEDGTINYDMVGAEEAVDLYSTLVSMADQLSDPVYMQLDASQVDEEMQEPLSMMQDYERLVEQKHQIEIGGGDLTEVQGQMDDIVNSLYDLDEETKIQLGIDGLSKEQLAKELEAGTLEIPATVDLQVEMSDDLKDIRLLLMNQAGLISDEDLELAIDLNVDTTQLDEYTPEEKTAIIKFMNDTDDFDSYTPEQKQAIVRYVKDIEDIDSWTPERKQGFCDFIVNNEDIMEYEPEDKYVIARYVADPSSLEQVDAYTEEERTIIARFVADHGDVDSWTPEDREAFVSYLLDITEIEGYEPEDEDATVVFNKDSTIPDNYQADNLDATVEYNADTSSLPEFFAPIQRTVSYVAKGVGKIFSAGADGTAHANGTAGGQAFVQGNWSTKDSGTALGGELGQEIVVRDGKFFTIGDNGAEFFKYKRGDIIFNHRQSEELFKNGYVTSDGGRGRTYAQGTAFSIGTGGAGRPGSGGRPVGGGSSSSSKKNTSSKSSSKAASKAAQEAADEFEETFDWIEIAIDRIERAIDNLNITASSTFKTWTERTKALNSQIAETRNEIDLQQQAYNRYLQQASQVGLSSDWASKVQSGAIDISTITDEDLANKIKEYQEWYEKALDARDAINELREAESELYNQRFENVQTKYDGILGVIQHEQAMLEESISQSEAKGYITSTKYYDALIKNQQQQTAQLKKQREEMLKELQSGMASGAIKKNSEAWYEQVNAINEVTKAIEEGNTAILEYQKSIQEINWQVFDLIQEQISDITSEADFLIDLMSNEKLFEKNGKLTDEGKATMGMHGLNYNLAMAQADKYREEVEKLNAEIAKDPYDQDLINRRNELLDLQRESILNAEDEKNAIKDLVEEGIERELDSLQELIDKRNEALESQKDMYEYAKKIQDQVDEISSLEKQLAALSGDDSEESKAKKQQLKDQLEEARGNLEETEMDKSISDQQALMDQLYTEYETILNTRLDNIDALVSQVIDGINSNSILISDTIREQAESVGYTLSNNMTNIWNASSKGTQDVLSYYGDNFLSKLTTTNSVINTINTNILNMINQLNKIANSKVSGAQNSNASNSGAANTKPTTPSTPKPSNPKPTTPKKKTVTVGGQINAGSARIYADSEGHGGGRQYYRNDPIYTVLQKRNGYVLVRHHSLRSGYTGWFKESDVKALKTGKRKMLGDDIVWTQDGGAEMIVRPSDGAILTPLAKNDSVLNARASGNIWNMANNPSEFIRNNLGTADLGSAAVNNGGNATYTQNFENIVFSLPNVKNYEQLLTSMQKDRNFERLVQSMTIDRVAGKSSIAKGKAIR